MPKKIYIAGKITGDPNYQLKFIRARQHLTKEGYTVLTPAVLPEGMTIADISKLLGHEKIETTMIYAHTCMETVQAGHRKYVV